MPDNLIQLNDSGEAIGINISAVKNWALKTTPFHTDFELYQLVHYRAKTTYLEELSRQATIRQLTHWTKEVQKALKYLELLIDSILEEDETTYKCDLRRHAPGENCPNRRHITLPDEPNWEDLTTLI